MDKSVIFHLPFEINSNIASASQIRPKKMIKAFEENGFEVDLVMGNSKLRKQQSEIIKDKIKNGKKYQFVYSESSTMPTLLTDSHHLPLNPTLDFGFLKFCRKNNIPIGLFYRDIHWKFIFYDKNVSGFKNSFAKYFYKYDLRKYNELLDVLFLPSLEMSTYIPELNKLRKESLPPGFEDIHLFKKKSREKSLNILYVGGINHDVYNLELFMECVKDYSEIRLKICCREYDFEGLEDSLKEKIISFNNIEIVHKKGDELPYLYDWADICCLFLKPIEYWNFAMPAKLFEYISYSKPIISVNNTISGEFVKKNGIGWSVDFNKTKLKELLEDLIENYSIDQFEENLLCAKNNNTWRARAGKVEEVLRNALKLK